MGVGTWTAFGAGKVLIGIDSGDTDFDTVLETGGSKTDSHTLTTSEIPSHTHTASARSVDSGVSATSLSQGSEGGATFTTNATGGGGAHTHDIVQPYIVVYMWRRTS